MQETNTCVNCLQYLSEIDLLTFYSNELLYFFSKFAMFLMIYRPDYISRMDDLAFDMYQVRNSPPYFVKNVVILGQYHKNLLITSADKPYNKLSTH